MFSKIRIKYINKFFKNYKPLKLKQINSFKKRYCSVLQQAQSRIIHNGIAKIRYYFYKNSLNNIESIKLRFKPQNFAHLRGLKYYRTPQDLYNALYYNRRYLKKYSGNQEFWNDLHNNQLNLSGIFITTFSLAKIQIINSIFENKLNLSIIGNQIIKTFSYKRSIKMQSMSQLALVHNKKDKCYYPYSLINLRLKRSHVHTKWHTSSSTRYN